LTLTTDGIHSVLVTGASGFVGTEVCATLVRAGLTVHGLTRRAVPLARGVIPHFAKDLADAAAIGSAADGVDAVIHLAARAHVTRERESEAETWFQQTNVEGTRTVFNAALAGGVRRFLFTSSIKVMGDYPGRPWTEEDAPSPTDAYGRSKLEAERLLVRAGPSANIEIGILRLPLVYGPRVRANMLQLFKLVDRGVPLPFGGTKNRRSILFSRNAADAMLSLLRVPSLTRDIFFVGDREALSTEALIQAIGKALRRPGRLFHLPSGILTALGKVGDMADTLVAVPLTTKTLERLVGSQECATNKLASVTGYQPRWSTEEGLAITAEWFDRSRRQPNRS
jgi:nucleoside-diphosphate-sugar epimerase